jgi:hypothetical protein
MRQLRLSQSNHTKQPSGNLQIKSECICLKHERNSRWNAISEHLATKTKEKMNELALASIVLKKINVVLL